MWKMIPFLLTFLAADAERKPLPWWLLLLILALIVVIVIWALNRNARASDAPHVEHDEPAEPIAEPVRAAEPVALAAEMPDLPDDLKIIEGIGPKIASLLNEAGISTFAQLAAANVADLRLLLEKAGLQHIADPGTWPEQAALAARGDVQGLAALQDSLKGGRKAN